MKSFVTEHQNNKRIFGLDIIRTLAILFVLIAHTSQHSAPPEWLKHFGFLGIIGVELFFVLSGFLIGGILLKLIEKDMFKTFKDLRVFWKRRWMRTVPLYIVALLAFLRFDYHGWHPLTFHPEYWLFLQNFAWPITDDFFTLSWSLSVEEHFYLWFPSLLLILYIFASKKVAFYTTVLMFLGISISYRISLPHMDWNEFNFNSRMVVLARLDAIMFGVLMVYVHKYHKRLWDKLSSLIILWLLLVLGLFVWYYKGTLGITTPIIQTFGMTIQAFLLSLLLPWFSNIKQKSNGFLFKGVVLTSKISYSLYLGHILVIIFINTMLSRFGLYDTIYHQFYYLYPLYFICFYILALFTYYTVEQPFLGLRDGEITKSRILSLIPFLILVSYLIFFA